MINVSHDLGTTAFEGKAAPEARGYPFLGVLPRIWGDPATAFAEMARDHGEVVHFRVLGRDSFLVSQPDLARTVLRDARTYKRTNRILKPLLGEGLLTSEGSGWRHHRMAMQPAFHVAQSEGLAHATIQITRDAIRDLMPAPGERRSIDFSAAMRHLTLRIATRRLFGATIPASDEVGLHDSLHFALEEIWRRRWSLLPRPLAERMPRGQRFVRAVDHVDAIVRRIVRERQQSREEHRDLLALLLGIRDETTGAPLTEQEIIDEVKVTLVTGHDGASNTLSWACHSLCLYPEVRQRLDAEIEGVLGSAPPSLETLPNLKWLKGIIQETLRLYPPAWLMGRDSPAEETTLGDYRIPPKSHVLVCPYILHRLPRHWEDPDRFDPARFAFDVRPNNRKAAYLPFGIGPHACIGESYALTMMRLVFALLWQNFTFELEPGHRVEPAFATSLTPRDGVRVLIRARSDRPS